MYTKHIAAAKKIPLKYWALLKGLSEYTDMICCATFVNIYLYY
jgi:hypothetical protein